MPQKKTTPNFLTCPIEPVDSGVPTAPLPKGVPVEMPVGEKTPSRAVEIVPVAKVGNGAQARAVATAVPLDTSATSSSHPSLRPAIRALRPAVWWTLGVIFFVLIAIGPPIVALAL